MSEKYNQKDINRLYALAKLFDDNWEFMVKYAKERGLSKEQPKILLRFLEHLHVWHLKDLLNKLENCSLLDIKQKVIEYRKSRKLHEIIEEYKTQSLFDTKHFILTSGAKR